MTYSESGELEPEDEKRLERIVPWEVVEENTEGERLDEGEGTEDHPVSQPLDVIQMTRGFEGLEGQVSGESPTEEVRNRCGERIECVQKEEKTDAANDHVRLGNLSALLKCLQRGVVVELSSIV